MAEWQLIELAPKDGTWQAVARFSRAGRRIWWERAIWSAKYESWKTYGGFCEPTHWLPLPDLASADAPFTREQHHELCIGVMAGCYRFVDETQKQAIREGIESAALLGFPVDCRNLEKGGPLFTGGNA